MTEASSDVALTREIQEIRGIVDARLQNLVADRQPAGLYEPVRYILQSGGKRLRPILLLATARIFEAADEDALPAALAVEVFHNFTLVHDDIMDHADERRGRETVHVKWDESTAILCGDFLLGLSYQLLSQSGGRASTAKLVGRFQEMVARLCEGQALDKEFETRNDVSVGDYLQMIDRKTGALLQASLELGAQIGGADHTALATLADVGRHFGRAFQIQDDLLDLMAVDDRWGKRIGSDLIEGKKTYLLLSALERGEEHDRTWFAGVMTKGGLPAKEVPEARERMRRSGVLEEARAEVLRYSGLAIEASGRLGTSPAVEMLVRLLTRMRERLH